MIFPLDSNELRTNVEVDLTIPLVVLGWGMAVESFKIIQILSGNTLLSLCGLTYEMSKIPI